MRYSPKECGWILFIAVALLPIFVFQAWTIRTDTDNILNWLPSSTVARTDYDRFISLFGHDDEIIISWPGCTVDDPRLAELCHLLTDDSESTRLFESATSGQTILCQLAGKKYSFSGPELQRRLHGVFFGDNNHTALVVKLSAQGRKEGEACVQELWRQIERTSNLSRSEVKIAGNVVTTVQIDHATSRALRFSVPGILLAILTAYVCLRNLGLVICVMSIAGYAALASIAWVSLLGLKFNGLLVIMPILVLVLTLSGLIHLCNYYQRAVRQEDDDPVLSMIAVGGWPCGMAIVTTVIGLVMLTTSHIPAVRAFGSLSALGLCFSLACALLLFPALLRFWPPVSPSLTTIKIGRVATVPFAVRKAQRILFWPNLIVAGSLIGMVISTIGLGKTRAILEPQEMFSRKSFAYRDNQWLSQRFPVLQAIEVVVAFPGQSTDADLIGQIRQVGKIQSVLTRLPCVKSAFSMANICRFPQQTQTAASFLQASMINDCLRREFTDIAERRLVAETEHQLAWRLRLGLNSAIDSDFRSVLHEIQRVSLAAAGELESRPEILVTGSWPVASLGRQLLFSDLVSSFIMAFVVITPLVMYVLKSVLAGLLAMIANIFPAMVFFGSLGWLGIDLDIGTILTAAVGLGIAIDDSLHFLYEYVRCRNGQALDAFVGVRQALVRCIRPMSYTTLICAVGMSPFMFSDFQPARQFAMAIIALLALALVADLILLPALLLSRLGHRWHCVQEIDRCETVYQDQNVAAVA